MRRTSVPQQPLDPLWYEVYGSPERLIRGSCTVRTRAGDLEGRFECVQVSDGGIYLQLKVPGLPVSTVIGLGGTTFEPLGAIEGLTSGGLPFRGEGLGTTSTNMTFGARTRLVICYMLSKVTIGDAAAANSHSVYGLTNVVFTPSHQKWLRRGLRSMMLVDFGPSRIMITPRRHYKRVENRMRFQSSCAVTCTARTDVDEQVMDWVCALIALAQGSFVNWIWREDYQSRRRVRLVLMDRVTRPYGGLPLLPVRQPGVIPEFVAGCLQAYGEKLEEYRLGPVVRLMCQARYGRYSDLETRGVTLAIILEVLAAAHSRKKGTEFRMPPAVFSEGLPRWRPAVRSTLLDAYGSEADIDGMMNSIASGLNRAPFASRILEMAKDLDLPAGPIPLERQIRRVVDSRNALIHTANFRAKRPHARLDEFFALMEFADRLILKLLNYSGRYMGWGGKGIIEKTLP